MTNWQQQKHGPQGRWGTKNFARENSNTAGTATPIKLVGTNVNSGPMALSGVTGYPAPTNRPLASPSLPLFIV
jgi:hypothetical protein